MQAYQEPKLLKTIVQLSDIHFGGGEKKVRR